MNVCDLHNLELLPHTDRFRLAVNYMGKVIASCLASRIKDRVSLSFIIILLSSQGRADQVSYNSKAIFL